MWAQNRHMTHKVHSSYRTGMVTSLREPQAYAHGLRYSREMKFKLCNGLQRKPFEKVY